MALDGERVVKLKPVFGYLHRNHEKIGAKARATWHRCRIRIGWTISARSPITGRMRWRWRSWWGRRCRSAPNIMRVILAELTRVQNHASAIGFLLQEMGASGTPLMYAFREREKILDLFESLTGSRMMCNYMRFGGCRVDPSPAWLDATRKVVAGLPAFSDEFEALPERATRS